jgi:L-lactate dehydrogenase complex protein LldG
MKRTQTRATAERHALMETLKRAAEPINLEVRVVGTPKAAAAAIARKVVTTPTEWGGPRQVCAWNHRLIDSLALESVLSDHEVSLITSATFFPPRAPAVTREQRETLRLGIIDSFVGVTAADFCVADTATLVLRTRPGQPRSMSLVPSQHIAVITVDQVLADLKELYAHLRWGKAPQPADLTTCMTFVSGPSKTADIEATLVHGAHGPRAVLLIVIDDSNT